MNKWLFQMYMCSFVGSLAGLFWPLLLTLYKGGLDVIHRKIALLQEKSIKFGGSQLSAPTAMRRFIAIAVFLMLFISLAAMIAAISSALGFAVFLQSNAVQVKFKNLGMLAYFSAFTYGFTSASLVEEGMKK